MIGIIEESMLPRRGFRKAGRRKHQKARVSMGSVLEKASLYVVRKDFPEAWLWEVIFEDR